MVCGNNMIERFSFKTHGTFVGSAPQYELQMEFYVIYIRYTVLIDEVQFVV